MIKCCCQFSQARILLGVAMQKLRERKTASVMGRYTEPTAFGQQVDGGTRDTVGDHSGHWDEGVAVARGNDVT